MQFLLEEFYKKIIKVGKGSPLPFRVFIKIMMFILIIGIIGLIIYSYITGKYTIALIIIGVVIISESAHYIRKLRERAMVDKISQENFEKKNYKEIMNGKLQKNKTLLGLKKSKNKALLKSGETKNDGLLRKR